MFSKEECRSIIWDTSRVIKGWDMKDRRYNSLSVEYTNDTKWIFDRLKNFFEDETDLKIIKIKKEIHFHKFSKGDWFGKHNDNRDKRLYGVGVLLNEDFEGGEFKMYNESELTLDKLIGNTYLFDVRIEHEVTPIISGNRYSLLWFLQDEHINFTKKSII